MRFKLDENMPVVVAEILRDSGCDAETVYGEAISGISDPELLDVCRHEHRILLTLDLDFANIVDYPASSYPGIVIFRLNSAGPDAVLAAVRRWPLAAAESPPRPGALWIVSNNRCGFAPLPIPVDRGQTFRLAPARFGSSRSRVCCLLLTAPPWRMGASSNSRVRLASFQMLDECNHALLGANVPVEPSARSTSVVTGDPPVRATGRVKGSLVEQEAARHGIKPINATSCSNPSTGKARWLFRGGRSF
ncbi:MAG: DUF5615 family PIN-like protein [Sulfobacillus sp.]